MHKVIRKIIKPKKVELRDVASPTPSRAATRVLNDAVKQAYQDQQLTTRKADALRSN
ncbi:MAG: hypothetical protein ACR2FM_03860 [Candidatus Saccharimonadales bacterium]